MKRLLILASRYIRRHKARVRTVIYVGGQEVWL